MTERKAKYNAVRTKIDGHTFASQKEARRYQELKLLERVGSIRNLTLQPKYRLVVNGMHVCNYIADFLYLDVASDRLMSRTARLYRSSDR